MSENQKVFTNTLISQLVGVAVSLMVSLVGYFVSDHFRSADIIKRVTALEGETVKKEIYNSDQKHIQDILIELKADVKTLLTRPVSSR